MTQASWTDLTPEIRQFFDTFDSLGGSPDEAPASGPTGTGPTDAGQPNAEPMGGLFAPTFLVVDPARVLTLTPQVLAGALPARRRMFDDAGVGALQRVWAEQLRLDDRHVLVSARWSANRTGAEPVQLSSTFLLRREEDGWQVVVYLNHRDVAALLAR